MKATIGRPMLSEEETSRRLAVIAGPGTRAEQAKALGLSINSLSGWIRYRRALGLDIVRRRPPLPVPDAADPQIQRWLEIAKRPIGVSAQAIAAGISRDAWRRWRRQAEQAGVLERHAMHKLQDIVYGKSHDGRSGYIVRPASKPPAPDRSPEKEIRFGAAIGDKPMPSPKRRPEPERVRLTDQELLERVARMLERAGRLTLREIAERLDCGVRLARLGAVLDREAERGGPVGIEPGADSVYSARRTA